ncbi:MAG: hypothetical protein HQL38_11610 [Alphaproteobacteria bacterium]|nr:hypothetical protein [Alphaproteobacteria bacterium]
MRYNVVASGQDGILGLKRDTIKGALKKAGELRSEGIYTEVRIMDTTTGDVVDESLITDEGL